MIEAHTDVIGSLLRPPGLLEAQKKLASGQLAATEFKRIEDRAVDDALRLQEEAGLEVVTDGEMRRLSFQSQVTAAVEGFGEWDLDTFLWGEWQSADLGEMLEELVWRIKEANAFVPPERLAISTQCGFASSVIGNVLSAEDQRAKLRVVSDTARAVWP